MTRLIDLGNNQYRVVNSTFFQEGTLRDVVQTMVFDLYISYKEIERALVAMNHLEHDGAEFGIYGTFIFSYLTKEVANVG